MPIFTDETATAFLDSLDDDLLDECATTDEEIDDAELRGIDTEALIARSRAAISELLRRRREAWQIEAREKMEERKSDRRPMTEEEARAMLAALGIDVDEEFDRLLVRLAAGGASTSIAVLATRPA